MKDSPPLRVIAVPGHMIADDLAYQNNNRFRFVGRSPSPVRTDEPENLELRFPPMVREYPNDSNHRGYIFRAIQKGSIVACDEFTSRSANVKFDRSRVEEIKKQCGIVVVATDDKPAKKVASSATKVSEG
jgi:hypothetical protein